MPSFLQKYAGEKEIFDIDFKLRLAAGETISTQTVAAYRWVMGQTTDVTSDLVEDSRAVGGNVVQFDAKKDATGATQPEGWYTVRITAITSVGRELVSEWDLLIVASAASRVS